jgi:hypothetical protein
VGAGRPLLVDLPLARRIFGKRPRARQIGVGKALGDFRDMALIDAQRLVAALIEVRPRLVELQPQGIGKLRYVAEAFEQQPVQRTGIVVPLKSS